MESKDWWTNPYLACSKKTEPYYWSLEVSVKDELWYNCIKILWSKGYKMGTLIEIGE